MSRTVYCVQVGAFSKKDVAARKLKAIQTAGFPRAFLAKEGDLWDVLVGSHADLATAEEQRARVEAAGFLCRLIKAEIKA